MPVFEISTPDGRILRQNFDSADAARKVLSPGYAVTATVIGADANGQGGWVEPIGGPSTTGVLLAAHGGELLDWLKANGVLFHEIAQ